MPALLWDVQAEHLGEAEYFFETWSAYVDSSAFSLADLAFGPEARLMAHVMGLVVAGQPVLDRMLRPVLDRDLDDDRYRTPYGRRRTDDETRVLQALGRI